MQRIPQELAEIARDTRTLIGRAQQSTDQIQAEAERLQNRLGAIEEKIHRLCGIATQGINMKTWWDLVKEKEENDHR